MLSERACAIWIRTNFCRPFDQCWTRAEARDSTTGWNDRETKVLNDGDYCGLPRTVRSQYLGGASDHFSPFKHLFKTFHSLKEPSVTETAEWTAIGTATRTNLLTVVVQGDQGSQFADRSITFPPQIVLFDYVVPLN